MAFPQPVHNSSEIIAAGTIKQGLNNLLLAMSSADLPN